MGRFGDLALAVLVLALSLLLRSVGSATQTTATLFVLLPAAVAVGVARRRPGWALALIWVAAGLQVVAGTDVIGIVVAILVVAYDTARHGRIATVWAAGVSIPLGAVLAVVYAFLDRGAFTGAGVVAQLLRTSGFGVTAGFLLVLAVPGVPFVLGLLFRLDERNRGVSAERDAAQARARVEHELAQAQTRRTALTRDVHDIVGHSLAVIIAQADAAQSTTRDAVVRDTLAQIAAVGRSSLADVRAVLSSTDEPTASKPATGGADLEELIGGMRSAGNDVHDETLGQPRELPDPVAATAYRVLQELLTNSLKHGAPGRPIEITRSWTTAGLTLRVGNAIAGAGVRPEGMGLSGVRARLDAVGGHLHTAVDAAKPAFVATAVVPHPART